MPAIARPSWSRSETAQVIPHWAQLPALTPTDQYSQEEDWIWPLSSGGKKLSCTNTYCIIWLQGPSPFPSPFSYPYRVTRGAGGSAGCLQQSENLKLDPRLLKGIFPSPGCRDICAGSCPAWRGGHLPLSSCKTVTVQPRFSFIPRASILSSFG